MGKITGIKHVFFDLDRTLWDLEKNSEVVLEQLIEMYGLESKCKANSKEIIKTYKQVNKALWQQYNSKKIDKEQLRSSRFTKTLAHFDYHFIGFGTHLEKEYIERSPYQPHVIEGSHEILEYLSEKYTLHVLTNGFVEVQNLKLKQSKLKKYFKHVFISEEIGHHKPAIEIFEKVREKVKAEKKECLMIGDDHNGDVQGALDAGWHAIHFNPDGEKVGKHIQVKSLAELKKLI